MPQICHVADREYGRAKAISNGANAMTIVYDNPERRGIAATRDFAAFVKAHTEIVTPPLVPEIRLHLAKQPRAIFIAADLFMDSGLGARPYWAYAWPGGQALARYILDHPEIVRGKRIVDIGSGSAVTSIACMMAGAASVLAADIDPIAQAAARLNAAENGVPIEVTTHDLLGSAIDADLAIIGDLVYEPDLKIRVAGFLEAAKRAGVDVLYGDRTSARRPPQVFRLLQDYEAPLTPPLVEDFIERARVWQL
jgi:predicted nicotinamide N-methyase